MVTQGLPLPVTPAAEVARPSVEDLTVSELRRLLANASRSVGRHLRLDIYSTGTITIDGYDCQQSIPRAVAHLKSLAMPAAAPEYAEVRLPLSTVMSWASAAGMAPEIRAACRAAISKVA